MPKLVQINVTDRPSTGKIATEIGRLATKCGWESWFAYGRGNFGSDQPDIIKIGTTKDILLHGFQSRIFDRHGLGSKNSTIELVKKIDKIKPDIIHLHNIHGYYLNYPVLFQYLKSINTPVVWTLHDCWPFTGHCAYFMKINCKKWQTGCGSCPALNSEYPKSLLDRSKKNYLLKKEFFTSIEDRLFLVPVSEYVGNYLKDSILKNCDYKVIKNGIDTETFKPCAEKKNKSVIAVSNVWSPRKGLEDIYRLRKILPSDYRITIVGLSEKQLRNLPEDINGIIKTENRQELAELYSESSFLINPTYEDNLPTVNLEALACGTPVITYRTGGSPETIDDKTGFVIEQGEVNKMAEIIMSNNDTSGFSSQCRERALTNFQQDICFKQYIDLYETLLQKR